jgi:hypothetical protein
MLAGEIFLLVFTMANAYWSFLNWRTRVNDQNLHMAVMAEAARIRNEANEMLRQTYRVCPECHKIRAMTPTDERCATCAGIQALKG